MLSSKGKQLLKRLYRYLRFLLTAYINVPNLKDVNTLVKLIGGLGVTISYENDTVKADTSTLDNQFAPYELVKTMRASILVL